MELLLALNVSRLDFGGFRLVSCVSVGLVAIRGTASGRRVTCLAEVLGLVALSVARVAVVADAVVVVFLGRIVAAGIVLLRRRR